MNVSGFPALQSVVIDSCSQTALSILNTQPIQGCIASINKLTSAQVDAVLVALDGNGIANGSVNLSGQIPPAPPTPTGLTAKTSLEGKGWTVTVDTPASMVAEWVGRVTGAGGAAPSAGTQTALTTFLTSLQTGSLLEKMWSVNCFVPDNLTAAFVPLVARKGYSVWVNSGAAFGAGDLTVNGLVGQTSPAKYLDTGFVPSVDIASVDLAGISLYVYTSVGDLGQCGCRNSNTQQWYIVNGAGTSVRGAAFDAQINGAAMANGGYVSSNRYTDITHRTYKANSVVAHVQAAQDLTPGGTRPTASVYAVSWNDVGSPPAKGDGSRISFMAMHEGLTSAMSSTFFNAIQAMRVALGGGYR